MEIHHLQRRELSLTKQLGAVAVRKQALKERETKHIVFIAEYSS
jgi:hypothetical protein